MLAALGQGGAGQPKKPAAPALAVHVQQAIAANRPAAGAVLPKTALHPGAPSPNRPTAPRRPIPPLPRVAQRMIARDPGETASKERPAIPWYWSDNWQPINYAGYRIPVFDSLAQTQIDQDTLIGGYSLVYGNSSSVLDLATEHHRVGGTYRPNHDKGKTKADSHVERQLFSDLVPHLRARLEELKRSGKVVHALVIEIKQWLLPCGGEKGCGVFLADFQAYLGDLVRDFSSVYMRTSSERISYSNTSAWSGSVGYRGGSRPTWTRDREVEGETGIFHVRPGTDY